MLALHRRLIALRRERPALAIGDIEIHAPSADVLTLTRGGAEPRLVVLFNLSGDAHEVRLPDGETRRVICSSGLDREGESVRDVARLRGNEALLLG